MEAESNIIGDVDFGIEIINFTLSQSNILDIKDLVEEFVYSEDINKPFTSLRLIISDSTGMPELFPLVGDELIVIQFKSPNENDYTRKLFKISSVKNRVIANERSHGYLIEAYSLEFFKNKMTSIGNSYKGKLGSEIVKNVFENYFLDNGYKEIDVFPKQLSIEDSSNLITINSNTQSPINFILQVAHSSYNLLYKSSVYRFYEDKDGYNFKTINGMLTKDPVKNLYLGASIAKDSDDVSAFNLINGITFGDTFDIYQRLSLGLIDNSVDIIDPITKTYVEKSFNYLDNFDDLTHIDSFPILSKASKYKGLDGSSSSNYVSARYNNSKKYTDVVPYINERITATNDPHLFHENQRYTFLMQHKSQVQSLSSYTLDITVPGDSKLKSGDIINVYIPQNSTETNKLEKYLLHFGQKDSKFFVNGVTHNYVKRSGYFSSILNVSKESFSREIQVDDGGSK